MIIWPTRSEKIKQFKERLLEDLEVQEDDGTIDAPDLDVDDWVRLDVTATSGTPGAVTACFTAQMDD